MKAFDTENSAWSRFSEEQRYQMESYEAANTVNFSIQPVPNDWPIKKYSVKPSKPVSAPQRVPSLKAGDKYTGTKRGKSVILAVIGSDPIEAGLKDRRLAHRLPPSRRQGHPGHRAGQNRLLKNPLLRWRRPQYQWVCMPLSLIGVVYKADGTRVDVSIGEDPNDPVLFINDLLPHLGKDQAAKN